MIKNGIIYIFILIGSFTLVVFFQEYYSVAAFIVLAIMPFVLMVINIISSFFIKITMKNKSVVTVMEDVLNVSIMIENKCIFPVQKVMILCQITDSAGIKKFQKFYTNVTALGNREIELHFKSVNSTGGYISIKKIRIYDFLGITCIPLKLKGNTTTFYGVYPKSYRCNVSVNLYNEPDMRDCEKYSEVQPGNDKNEIFNIREYAPGDQVRNIHWKLSSKKDEIMLKEFSKPLETGIKIVFDTMVHRNNNIIYRLLSKYYEFAQSLCETLLQLSVDFSVVLFNEKTGAFEELPVENNDNVYMIMEMLLRQMPPKSKKNASAYRDKGLIADEISGDIIYVSCGADEKFLKYLSELIEVKKIYMICIGKDEHFAKEAERIAADTESEFICIAADDNIMNMKCLEL